MTKANLLNQYSTNDVVASQFDRDSIMIYDVQASWTRDGFTASRKNNLSAIDKLYLQKAYTKRRRDSSPL
ncbi:hypothetical protein F4806DRAFT_481217 [Annulohypoxylon nitens]|nr:hypothetical protein F4806DRAFT_481217 [Annulohypoxylon nitens]